MILDPVEPTGWPIPIPLPFTLTTLKGEREREKRKRKRKCNTFRTCLFQLCLNERLHPVSSGAAPKLRRSSWKGNKCENAQISLYVSVQAKLLLTGDVLGRKGLVDLNPLVVPNLAARPSQQVLDCVNLIWGEWASKRNASSAAYKKNGVPIPSPHPPDGRTPRWHCAMGVFLLAW